MIKHPRNSAHTQLTNVDQHMVQPNALDIRLDRVLSLNQAPAIIGGAPEDEHENKVHRGSVVVQPDQDDWYFLGIGSYEVTTLHTIEVGQNEGGWVQTRSTLNRNGCFLTSGWFDSQYNGALALCLHVTSGPLRIKRGTRIGQYFCASAEQTHGYDGDYGFNNDGTLKVAEEKYHESDNPSVWKPNALKSSPNISMEELYGAVEDEERRMEDEGGMPNS